MGVFILHLNGHHIIDFAMQRWGLTKKQIAEDYLLCPQGALSRKTPHTIKPRHYYQNLFDTEYLGSAANGKGESKDILLRALYDFMAKANLSEADLISQKLKEKASYKEIIIEILTRAKTQPKDAHTSITTESGMSIAQKSSAHSGQAQSKDEFANPSGATTTHKSISQISFDYQNSRKRDVLIRMEYNPDSFFDKTRLLTFIYESDTFDEFYEREIAYLQKKEAQNYSFDEASVASGLTKLKHMYYTHKKT